MTRTPRSVVTASDDSSNIACKLFAVNSRTFPPYSDSCPHSAVRLRSAVARSPSWIPAFNTSPAWLRTNTEMMPDGSRKARAALRNTARGIRHRLNKAQQDSLLPPSEDGTLTLIGATTENPSFEINGALLSRTRVFVLEPLAAGDLETLLRRALTDPERGLGESRLEADDDAIESIAVEADGDARRALTVLEAAAAHVGAGGSITTEVAREAMQKRFARYDKGGEEHFNLLSAYHKSLRGSDPQGALYWMARMLDGGEDPMTLFRRAIAMAAEDIGLADPNALTIAVAARDAFHMLGPPEGFLPLAEMTIYLATAPKSNSAKVALGNAMEAAWNTPAAPAPLHIRNAPTGLMKELRYGRGHQYADLSRRIHSPGISSRPAPRHRAVSAGSVRLPATHRRSGSSGWNGEAGNRRGRRDGQGKVRADLEARVRTVRLLDDVEPAMDALTARGYLLGAITNGNFPLHRLPLAGRLAFIVHAEHVGEEKPAAAPFARAAELAGIGSDRERWVHVGDSVESDVLGAQRFGLRAVWLNRRGLDLPEDVHPDAELRSLEALPETVDRLLGQPPA